MGKASQLGSLPIATALIFSLLSTASAGAASFDKLQKFAKKTEKTRRHRGKLGVFVKDLDTSKEFSLNAEKPWYLASGVKLPIAMEVLRQVESGQISLSTRVVLRESDYVDGAGFTNLFEPGSRHRVGDLLEQMLVYSDNTASDLLIRLVGLDNVNHLVKEKVPEGGFAPITRLADVRRLTYGRLHPRAGSLAGRELLALKALPNEKRRVRAMASLLSLSPEELRMRSLQDAFAGYYESQVNSASLSSYVALLETLVEEEALGHAKSKYLLSVMERAQTGSRRTRAGLDRSFRFAHKTGTQRERVCDFGVFWKKGESPSQGTLVAACVRDLPLRESEALLKSLGASLSG